MRMDRGVELLPHGQEQNGESSAVSTSELVQWSDNGRDVTAQCQVGGHVDFKKIRNMPNEGTQVVHSHFLKCHTELNVKIRGLHNKVGTDQDPPHILKLRSLSEDAPMKQT